MWPVLEHVMGHQANDVVVESLKTELTDRLRARFGRPGNHDIARAVRVAELQATEYLMRAYQKLLSASAECHELVDQEYEPDKFIGQLSSYLDKAFRRRITVQLTERHREYDPGVVGREIAFGAVGYEGPDHHLIAEIETEIAVCTDWKPQPLPNRFVELLRHGNDANGIPSWPTAFRAFLGEQIKTNPRFRDILHTVLLHHIRAAQQQDQIALQAEIDRQLSSAVEAQRVEFRTLGERLSAVERRLIATHGSLDSYLALVGNVEARLTDLLYAASDPEALEGAVQSVLDRGYTHIGLEAFQGTRDVLGELGGPLFGRQAALDKLDHFLTEHDRGVLLITASAGVGKSALLAGWSGSIAGLDTIAVRHFFTTKRPECSTLTSLVRSVAGQIALMLAPDVLGSGTPGDTNDLADRITHCLRHDRPLGSRLVVVLDSLDEAAEPITPFGGGELGRGCYLIVSARAERGERSTVLQRWRELANKRGCRFEEMELRTLDRSGIRAWLSAAPEVSTDADEALVERVWRTSEGVPLFVRFIVPDAIARLCDGSGTWSMHKFPESFVEYARGKLDELRTLGAERHLVWSEQIERLFALLVVAKGPISESDIAAIVNGFMLSGGFIDPRVQRWFTIRRVAGEAFASFVHPRLASVFREALSKHVISDMQIRLLDHCRIAWRAHVPFLPSSYALEFLPAHLVDLGAIKEAMALVHNLKFILGRLTLPRSARLVSRTMSEITALNEIDRSHREPVFWWARLWSSIEAPLLELGEHGGFGPTTTTSALTQILTDLTTDGTSAQPFGQALKLEAAPSVSLSRPMILGTSNLARSIDHAHPRGVGGVISIGDRLVSWGKDGAIRFWSAAGERSSGGDDNAHASYVGGVLSLGDRLVSWGGDGAIRFWSAAGNRLPGGDDHAHIRSICGIVPFGERLVSWDEDGAIRFWSAVGERLSGGDDHAHKFRVMGVLPLADRLVSWGSDGAIRFWSAAGDRLPGGDDHAHARTVFGVQLVHNRLVSWGSDGAIRFWSVDGERLQGGDDSAHEGIVWGVLPFRDLLVSWGRDGAIRFWSTVGDRLVGGGDHAHAVPNPVGVVGVRSVGGRLVSWGGDGAIRFWSAAGERLDGGDDHAHAGVVLGVRPVGDQLVPRVAHNDG
jgi:WD40 repeat protein